MDRPLSGGGALTIFRNAPVNVTGDLDDAAASGCGSHRDRPSLRRFQPQLLDHTFHPSRAMPSKSYLSFGVRI